MKIKTILLIIMLITLGLTACTPAADTGETLPSETVEPTPLPTEETPIISTESPPDIPMSETENPLEGSTWVLSAIYIDGEMTMSEIDLEITAEFKDGQINGFAGCNKYFTGYQADETSLTLDMIGSTRMACEEARMQRESEFLAALETVTNYRLDDTTLELLNETGAVQLRLENPQESAFPEELLGTWQWKAYLDMGEINDITVPNPEDYSLTFLADGSVAIKAHCNTASGGATVANGEIHFGAMMTTLAECGPESLYNDYLTDLNDVVGYIIEGDSLYLNLMMDAGTMVFER